MASVRLLNTYLVTYFKGGIEVARTFVHTKDIDAAYRSAARYAKANSVTYGVCFCHKQ